MTNRKKATDISNKVRQQVKERDKWCIFCGRSGHQIAHFVPRSSAGLGIPENLGYVCVQCHINLDQSTMREEMLIAFRRYLNRLYPDFKDEDRKYNKWQMFESMGE